MCASEHYLISPGNRKGSFFVCLADEELFQLNTVYNELRYVLFHSVSILLRDSLYNEIRRERFNDSNA